MNYIILFLITIFFIACEAKPQKQPIPGLTPQDRASILGGLLLSTQLQDQLNGTVIDRTSGLRWQKCVFGQTWRSSNNDCQGNLRDRPGITQDLELAGAVKVGYCSPNLGVNQTLDGIGFSFAACNQGGANIELANPSTYPANARSDLFTACSILGSGWRVPNKAELTGLAVRGRIFVLQQFPNTPEDNFWTVNSNVSDTTFQTAVAVSFVGNSFGEARNVSKLNLQFVRCVRSF